MPPRQPEPPPLDRLRLRRLEAIDFKGIDKLQLEFPSRTSREEPDATVMGSRNGLGKTSVLEAISLLLIGLLEPGGLELALHDSERLGRAAVDPYDFLIRAGAGAARVVGDFAGPAGEAHVEVTIQRSGGGILHATQRGKGPQRWDRPPPGAPGVLQRYLELIGGVSLDPLLAPPLLYFHSYRKVQEGSPELGLMLGPSQKQPSPVGSRAAWREPVSAFKTQVLRAMMGKAGLFEGGEAADASETVSTLEVLLKRYAGGALGKLAATSENSVDLRVHPVRGQGSFSFDGLSSGQKEIISFMFLLWQCTRAAPAIVLVDEPELHLNAEWQRDFLLTAHRLQPQNQYIFATHSEEVFASVPEHQRVLLEQNPVII